MKIFLSVCVCVCGGVCTHAFLSDIGENRSTPLGQKIMDQVPSMTKGCNVPIRFSIGYKVAKLYLDENKRDQGRAQVECSQSWLGKKQTVFYVLVFLFLEGTVMFPFYSKKERENITFDLLLLHR